MRLCNPASLSCIDTIFPVRDIIYISNIRMEHLSVVAEHLIPPDSRVEIDAKIAAGYFTSGKQITEADLIKTVGRTWEETEH